MAAGKNNAKFTEQLLCYCYWSSNVVADICLTLLKQGRSRILILQGIPIFQFFSTSVWKRVTTNEKMN